MNGATVKPPTQGEDFHHRHLDVLDPDMIRGIEVTVKCSFVNSLPIMNH